MLEKTHFTLLKPEMPPFWTYKLDTTTS